MYQQKETAMTRKDIINEVEKKKKLEARYSWSKSYDNGTMLTEYALYYDLLSNRPVAWLQVGFSTDSDEVIGADISYNIGDDRHEIEIERIEDISEIVKRMLDEKYNYYFPPKDFSKKVSKKLGKSK